MLAKKDLVFLTLILLFCNLSSILYFFAKLSEVGFARDVIFVLRKTHSKSLLPTRKVKVLREITSLNLLDLD